MRLLIGEVAQRTGCSVPTIRYYEQIGLIPAPMRSANGRRSYGYPEVSHLRFIRRARDFGMSIEQVRDLLNAETQSREMCEPAKSILTARLEEVAQKRGELEKLQSSLEAMLSRCSSQCAPDSRCCTIFEDMGQPAKVDG